MGNMNATIVWGLGVLVHTQHCKSVCPSAVNEELIIHPPTANKRV